MKLYLVEREGGAGYDELGGVLVRATNAKEARSRAAGVHGDEGPYVWHDPAATTCRQIKAEGPEAILITDFHAGWRKKKMNKPKKADLLSNLPTIRKLQLKVEERERRALFAYLDSINSANLSDGAWWQSMEDGVSEFNKVKGTSFEPDEMVYIWAKREGSGRRRNHPDASRGKSR